MNWLTRLKESESTADTALQKLQKGVYEVFVGPSPGPIQKSRDGSSALSAVFRGAADERAATVVLQREAVTAP